MSHARSKSLSIAAFLLALAAFPASASMVSFMLVETGVNLEEAPGNQHSRLWESGLMSVFFDSDFIVTSSPIAQMKTIPSTELAGDIGEMFTEAVNGGADYFVVGFIEYSTVGASPQQIAVKVYDSSRRLIHRESFPAGTGRNDNEELELARNAGRFIISRIKDI